MTKEIQPVEKKRKKFTPDTKKVWRHQNKRGKGGRFEF